MMPGKRHTLICRSGFFPAGHYRDILEKIYDTNSISARLSDMPDKDLNWQVIMLFEDADPLACVTLFCPSDNNEEHQDMAYLGYFESAVLDCDELFTAAEELARSLGIGTLIGPLNGSTWEQYRFTVKSDHPPFLGEPSHPDYYPLIWKKNGYKIFSGYYSSLDRIASTREAENESRYESFLKKGFTFRNIRPDNFDDELTELHGFCLKAFERNFLYSPVSLKRFKEKYVRVKHFIDPRFVIIGENASGEICGFIFCIPNVFNTNDKQLIVKTIARNPGAEYLGLGETLGYLFMKEAVEAGYQSVIHAFMHQDNSSRQLSSNFNGEIIRKYVLMSKQL